MQTRAVLLGKSALVVALLLPVSGIGSRQAQAQGLNADDAQGFLEAERYDDAIDAFNQILRDDEDDAAARSGLGRAYLGKENYAEATREFLEALAVDDELADAKNGLGEAFLAQGMIAGALQNFNEAVKLDSANAGFLLDQGMALTRVGDAKKAHDVLTKVIEMGISETGDLARAYEARARALTGLGKFDRAQIDLSAAIQLEPDEKDFYLSSAMAYMADKDYRKCIAALDKSLAVDASARKIAEADPESIEEEPPYVQPLFYRVSALMELAMTFKSEENKNAALQMAIDDCNRGLDILPNQANLLYQRGMAERQLGRHRDALDSFTKTIPLMPEESEVHFRCGVAWFYLNEPEMALNEFDEALEIDYEDIRPYLWKGFTHAKQGDYRKAITAYGRAITQNPRFIPAYTNRGLAYLQLGEHEKAIDNFNQVLRINPNSPKAFFKRGQTFLALNDNDRAITSFISAIERDPDYVEAYRRAAFVYDRLGDRDQAAEYRRLADQREQQQKESAEAAAQAETPVDEIPFLAPSEDAASGDNLPDWFGDPTVPAGDSAFEDSTPPEANGDDTGPIDAGTPDADLPDTESDATETDDTQEDSVIDDFSDDDLFGPT